MSECCLGPSDWFTLLLLCFLSPGLHTCWELHQQHGHTWTPLCRVFAFLFFAFLQQNIQQHIFTPPLPTLLTLHVHNMCLFVCLLFVSQSHSRPVTVSLCCFSCDSCGTLLLHFLIGINKVLLLIYTTTADKTFREPGCILVEHVEQ